MRIIKTGLQILTVFILCSSIVKAQENPREAFPAAISFYGGGPTFFASASLDVFLSPNVNMDFGAGFSGFYGGGKYHFKGHHADREWTFYTGLVIANLGEAVGTEYLYYFPLGYNYIGEKGLNFSIEALVIGEFLEDLFFEEGLTYFIPAWPGLKIGYRF